MAANGETQAGYKSVTGTADEHRFELKEETYSVIGTAMKVLNTLGLGLLEKPDENAMVVEFGMQGIPFNQQPRFDVICKEVKHATPEWERTVL